MLTPSRPVLALRSGTRRGGGSRRRYFFSRRPRDAVATLEADYTREVEEADATLRAAEALFIELIAHNHLVGTTIPSPLRAAVSCLLLEQIALVHSRYHRVLDWVVEVLLRSVFLPNTDEFRAHFGDLTSPLQLPGSVSPEVVTLLEPYARKTYFQAYDTLFEALSRYTRYNRSVEVKLSRQSKIFDQTLGRWANAALQGIFSVWRGYTQRRVKLRAKYRGIFLRLRDEESMLRAVRRWRVRAASLKTAAIVDAASAEELISLRAAMSSMHSQLDVLTDYTENLDKRLANDEIVAHTLQSTIHSKERMAHDMVSRIRDITSVTNDTMNKMLFASLPPPGGSPLEVLVNWAHGVIDAVGGTIDGSVKPFAVLLSDDFSVEVPASALGCVMLGFTGDRAPSREAVLRLHVEAAWDDCVSMYQRLSMASCPVNGVQLASGQRGVVLLFLAGLMRFATQWLQCPSPAPVGAAAQPLNCSSPKDHIDALHAWTQAALAAQSAALAVALHHPQSLTPEEAADEPEFLTIPMRRIADILPLQAADRRHFEWMKALRSVYVDLRQVYVSYASPTLTFADVIKLLKDCALIGDRKLTRKVVESQCKAVWRTDAGQERGIAADGIGSTELTKAQFTELVLRLANAELRRSSKSDADLQAAHVTAFVTDKLAGHTQRRETERFRSMILHPQTQAVIAARKIALRRMFRKYANGDGGETMDRAALQRMASDCRWISRTVSSEVIVDLFKWVQSSVDQGSASIDISEWLECLCAVAVHRNPNPFVQLPDKLALFLDTDVLQHLQ